MSDLQPTWVGRTIGSRYVINALLGRGGMSSVYKATDPNLQRTVAIKIIHPHLSEHPEFVKRFEQEAAAVARLRHPNIMLVHDFNHDGGVYYIVFEYIAGTPLDKRLKDLKEAGLRLPLSESLQIMIPLCEAVAYAHESKMVHRDLKPSNVIINLLGQPILLDFGIAKLVGGGHVHTATGATIGTAAYMAPEQVVGDEVDHRADIYSLGVMLYEMACGRPPYEGQSALTVMMKHVNEPLPDIRLFNSNLPDVFNAVLEKALAKDPKTRFGSAVEMATALRNVGRQLNAASDEAIFTTPSQVSQPPQQTAVPTPKPATKPDEAHINLAKTEIGTPEPVTEPIAKPEPTTAKEKSKRNWLPIALGGLAVLALIAAAVLLLPKLLAGSPPTSAGMVQLPAGTYTVGADLSGSQYAAPQQITLEAFWIDRYEVSNKAYAAFVADTEATPPSNWTNGTPPTGLDDHPVRGLTWENAYDYCDWLNKRLPTEAEWEVAARGSQGLLYPWGDNVNSVSLPQDNTYASGSLPANRSSFGVFDMAGNVWEWVDEPYTDVSEDQAVARGGAFDFLKDMAYRLQGDPNLPTMIASTGVRCAASEVELVPDDALLLADDFTNPESGWPDLKEDNAWRGYHPPDFYHVETTGQNQVATAVFGTDAANVSLEAQMFVDILESEDGGYRYGLLVRQVSERQFYAFTVSPRASEWAVLKATEAGLETLASGPITGLTGGSTIPVQGGSADAADTLRVDATGNVLSFFVNGRIVTTLTDNSYSNGDFGFYVETIEETRAHVHYDAVTVLELNDALVQTDNSVDEIAVEPTVPAEPTTTPEAAPTETAVATPEPTTTNAPSPTPEPTERPLPKGMVLIPGGSFLMGSETGEANERPEHSVTLDAYFIDQFEVSNEQYQSCVADGGCTQTGIRNSFRRAGYRDDPIFANYPVMGVTWTQANAYCQWAGKRLPTEAEWEFAASGPDNFTWPWGNTFDATLSAASSLDTEPIDDFADGTSPFGVFNMAGNVNEWVQDRFDANFYANSPTENPVNLDSGTSQIYRGGSFDNTNGTFFTTSRRYVVSSNTFDVDIGFRCAQSPP
ncbi:MAG: SUMF1/EgtB/PvdO family nonheme iron enzyme [Ardenticatenaceae bacterium]|nr:SUMF1/EgtB/PvdO family nonheme iron enzyme [Anaerolineales bacterium]MCB8941656.1 SUMF1/EgtB/PvdO family nonheme iron enzyme [Ardenticatenaceae bacterium]MCB8974449.1 SUMF1/EgtB/PvdO family nonheme iron enzyme [Ardenticatenaceae bacterium]